MPPTETSTISLPLLLGKISYVPVLDQSSSLLELRRVVGLGSNGSSRREEAMVRHVEGPNEDQGLSIAKITSAFQPWGQSQRSEGNSDAELSMARLETVENWGSGEVEKYGFDACWTLVLSRDFVGSATEEVACRVNASSRNSGGEARLQWPGTLKLQAQGHPASLKLPLFGRSSRHSNKSSSASRQLLFSFNHPAPKPSSLPPSQLRVIN